MFISMSYDGLSVSLLRKTLVKLDRRGLLNCKETTWSRRLFKWLQVSDLYSEDDQLTFAPSDYVAYLKTLRLSAHQSEIFYLCRVFRVAKYPVNYFEIRSWKIVEPVIRDRKVLPNTAVIRSNLLKLDLMDGLFLLLLYVSGRRSIDLVRLQSNNVTVSEDNVHIVLEYCKTKRHSTTYFFSILHDLAIDDLPYLKLLGRLLKNNAIPFENFSVSKLALKLTFTPHTLRSCRAIHLVLEGLSFTDVMSRIGWSSENSFKHYVRLPTTSIVRIGNYDSVVAQINSQL